MSQNIVKNAAPTPWALIQTKIILKTIMVMVALFGLLASVVPVQGLTVSPAVSTTPRRTLVVNDIGDAYYNPFIALTAANFPFPLSVGAIVDGAGTVITNSKGKAIVTLRYAIENTNRDCDSGENQDIEFDWANMTLDGKPIAGPNAALTPTITEGTKDLAGFYTAAGGKTFRLSLNTFLPDLICAGTVINAEAGSTNTAVLGKAQTVGILTDAKPIAKIKQPMLELMPKSVSTYVRAISVGNKALPALDPTVTGKTKYNSVFNCGLYLRADDQAVLGLSIFGFGGGGINDANLCAGPYSSQAGAWMPDPSVKNAVFDPLKAVFPINNKNGYCYGKGAGYTFSQKSFNAAEVAAAVAGCGNFIDNQPEYSSMYETSSVDTNDTTYNGIFNGNPVFESAKSPDQNSQGVKFYRNVIGATATLLEPAKASFNWATGYNSADASAIAMADFHSKGSGIMALGSDKGYISENIIMYNGGATRDVAPFGSQAGVLFEIASYTGASAFRTPNSIDTDSNNSPVDDEVLNTEAWVVTLNELAMNVDNNRDFGGHGVFINIAQNGSSINADWFHRIENNDIYQNGGSGVRTFSPRVNVIGNKVYDNGKDGNLSAGGVVDNTYKKPGAPMTNPAPVYSPKAPSFKHGIYMECGTGYVFHNEVYGHEGSAVATAGGNMYCANGGEPISGGVVISENSFYNNLKLGIDLFVEYTTEYDATKPYAKYAKSPSNNIEFEKPIGSDNDTDSTILNTGVDPNGVGSGGVGGVDASAPGANRQFVTLNTIESLNNIRAEVVLEAGVPRAFASAINGQPQVVAANLSTPFPVFTYSTIDCSTGKIRIHGYVAKDNVVEVFTPDFDGGANTKGESYQEGKTYLFDFSDDGAWATTETDLSKKVGAYSNQSVIVDEAGVPLAEGKINDLPILDPATGLLSTYSKSSLALPTVDKVISDAAGLSEVLDGDLAHEFIIETDKLAPGNYINATATDYTADPGEVGTTSEFSPNFLISPINACQTASIVKAWVGKTQTDVAERLAPADPVADKLPNYAAGETLNFTITITNEDKVNFLQSFNLKDDSFANNANLDQTSLSCVPAPASGTMGAPKPGTPLLPAVPNAKSPSAGTKDGISTIAGVITPVTPYTGAQLVAGTDIHLVKPIKPGDTYVLTCSIKVLTATNQITNTATLAEIPTLVNDEKKPLYPLKIVAPTVLKQTDLSVSPLVAPPIPTLNGDYPAYVVAYTKYVKDLLAALPSLSTDRIDALPLVEQASIVKSWDAGVEPQEYKAGDPLKFTITVYNESKTAPLTGFTIKDAGFNADTLKTLSCTPSPAGTPAGPFDLAAMTAGVSFKPTTAVAVGGKVEFKCVETVIADPLVTVAPAVITNKAILSAFDPTKPETLEIYKPKTNNTTAKDQTDKTTVDTIKNDPKNAEDSITAIPVSKHLISIQKAWVTDPVSYILGTPLDFTISITNEGTTPVTKFNLVDDNFGGKATGMTCDNGFTTFAGQDITLTTALAPKAVLVIKCTAVLAPADTGVITNKATLAPAAGDTTTNVVAPQTLPQSDKDVKTDLTVFDTALAKSDSISVPPAPQASIVKAWDAGVNPQVYAIGDVLKFTITVTNESKTAELKTFKLTDDNFAGKEVASDLACVPTPAPTTAATFDAAGLKAGVVYVTTAPIAPQGTVKFACTVKATTATQDITNTATLAPASATDKLGIVAPVALKQTDTDVTDPANTAKDAIKAIPKIESASLIKAWVAPTVEPGTYQAGDTLNFTITVANESPTFTLTQFLLTDKGFDTDANADLECTPSEAPTAPLTAAQLAAGTIFIPTTPIAVGKTVVFTCKQTIKSAAGALSTNKAVLAPALATAPLLIVKPGAGSQTDKTTSATANDVTNTEDSITATPIFPSASIIKAWSGANPSPYADGGTLTYTVKVTNESTNKAVLKSFKLSDDNFAGKVTPGTCTGDKPTTPATIAAPLPATDIVLTTALKPAESVTFTCTGTVKAGTTGDLINTAVLAPSAADPKLTVVAPAVATGKQSDENGVTTDVTTDTIKATKAPVPPQISIIKAWTGTAPTSYKKGDTLKYTITVTNEGTVDVLGFVLKDDLFNAAANLGATTCTGTPAFATFVGQTFTYAAGAFAKQTSKTFDCTVAVTADSTATLKNTVTLSSDPANPSTVVPPTDPKGQSDKDVTTPSIPVDSISVPPAALPVLYTINKKILNNPNAYKPGDTLKYLVTVTNWTPGTPIKQFNMKDDCGTGLLTPCTYTTLTKGSAKYDSATGLANALTWVAAPDAKSTSLEFTVTGVVKAGQTGDIKNIATLDPTLPIDPLGTPVLPVCAIDPTMVIKTDADGKVLPCNDNVITPPAPLVPIIASLIKAWVAPAPTNYKRGDTVTYTIEVRNEGTSPLVSFNLKDDEFAAATTGTVCDNSYTQFDGALFTPAAPVAVGKSIIIKCTAKIDVTASGTLTNTATLSVLGGSVILPSTGTQSDGDTLPADPATTIPEDSIDVTPLPELSIRKVPAPRLTEYKIGEAINYEVIVTNVNPAATVDTVKITDDCGAGAQAPCTVTSADGTYDAATGILSGITWTLANEVVFKVTGIVKAGTTGPIKNTATLDLTVQPDSTDPTGPKPVCAIDPKMTRDDGTPATAADCVTDNVITPAPGTPPSISIRKVLTSATNKFAPGDTFTYDVIITKISGTVTQVKVTDDCAGGLLEGATAGTPCTIASTDGTFDAATGILSPITWSATKTATFKVTGKVKAGTTTDVINVAKFDPTFPADPTKPTVLPVCAIDPNMTNADGTPPSAADCNKDEVKITPIPKGNEASIVKAWDFYSGYYTLGDTLAWTVTVTNEGTTPLTKFNIKDDMFGGAPELDKSTFVCFSSVLSPTVMTADKWIAGFDFEIDPLFALDEGEFVEFACSVDVIADGIEGETLTNTATLAPAAGQTLTRVPPNALQQSDLDTSTQEEIDSDHLFIDPEVWLAETPYLSIVKKWVTVPASYKAGDEFKFEIIVTNEGNIEANYFTIQDDMFDHASNVSMTCDNGYTDFAGQEFDLSADPLMALESFVITCKVKILSNGTQELKNEVTLIFEEGDIIEPSGVEKQSDGLVGDPANDAKDSIRVKPFTPVIVPVVVTPRTGGQIAIGASVIALMAIAFLTLRKRFTVKK
jgi:Domain of unknown function DUF11